MKWLAITSVFLVRVGIGVFCAILALPANGQAQVPTYDYVANGIDQARVSVVNGVPQLLINEQPVPPLVFFYNEQANNLSTLAPQVRFAAANGIHIYSLGQPIPWTGADYRYLDAHLDLFIAADPNAVFLFRIQQDVVDPTGSLNISIGEDNTYLDGSSAPISVASDVYFDAYKAAIQRFVTRYESSAYAKRILGYHVGGGENSEWFPRAYREKGLDYSPANTSAFRGWLRKKYGTDANLSQAWGRVSSLSNAAIPVPRPGRFPIRSAPGGTLVEAFYTLPTEQDWVDYSAYISDITAERILALAKIIKDATQRKKLVAFFNGYTFDLPGSMNGHLGIDRLLRSPDIDMLAAPHSYIQETDRLAGGPAGAMSALDSVAAHGKIWMNENDLRTHLAAASILPDCCYNGSNPTSNFAETYNVLLRDLGAALVHRAGTWWMDLNGTGAFSDSGLWNVMSDFGLHSYNTLYGKPRPYLPEVAVIVDPRSVAFQASDYDLVRKSLANLRNAVAATGATIGYYYLDDFLDGTLPASKVYLFANAFFLTDDHISTIQARLASEGATAIWQYAPGYLGPSGADLTRSARLTGMTMQQTVGKGGTKGEGAMLSHSWGWTSNPISPRISVNDPDAEIIGRYSADGLVSSARKKVNGYQSVFLGDLDLSTSALREILRQSGAHIWARGGEIVHTDMGLLVVHRKDAGVTRIHVPDGVTVSPLSGSVQPVDARSADAQFAQYETRLFRVETATSWPDLNQHGLTGSWYEPATSGQGIEIEVYPDLTAPGTGLAFLSWFTYDSVVGGADRQRWYTAVGPVVTGQPNAALTIHRNTGGNFNAPPVTESTVVGTATLGFDSCTTGTLSYNFTDGTGRTGSIPLTRLTQSMTCSITGARPTNADFAFSGNWYDPATSGQGITVEANTASQALFLAWYTYAPNGAGAGAAGQRWYTAEQTTPLLPGMRTIPLRLFETTGGAFDAPTNPAPSTVVVGSGTLTFDSCSSATLSYSFTGGSSGGASGAIALRRVGPVPAGCAM